MDDITLQIAQGATTVLTGFITFVAHRIRKTLDNIETRIKQLESHKEVLTVVSKLHEKRLDSLERKS